MDHPTALILSICLAIVAAGCMAMGYRLFAQAKAQQAQMCASLGKEIKLGLRDMAPGIYFSALGSALLVFVLVRGPFAGETPSPSADAGGTFGAEIARSLSSPDKANGPSARADESSKPKNTIQQALESGNSKGSQGPDTSGDAAHKMLEDLKSRVLGNPKSPSVPGP